MSDQITLLEITDIGKEGIGFKFHGLKHFNDKWFSWAAISKAILHREDEIIIDQKCTMPNYKQLQSQVEQQAAKIAGLKAIINESQPAYSNKIVPDSQCKQSKCANATTGCVGYCKLDELSKGLSVTVTLQPHEPPRGNYNPKG